MSNEISVGITARIPNAGALLLKPSYLIVLESGTGKAKTNQYFITLDKPEFLNGFIQVKGIFVDTTATESEVIKNYVELLTSAEKDLFCEIYFAWQKICHIRSLVYKAK